MKYIYIQLESDRQLFLFAERMDHSSAFQLVREKFPKAALISAGKLHIEEADCYPGEHYVSVTPGSVTLEFTPRSATEYKDHADMIYPLLREPLEFIARETNVYLKCEIFSHLKGTLCRLQLHFLPEDNYCPRATVTLSGLEDAYDIFTFWQAFKRL
jgi:hypothetical protein